VGIEVKHAGKIKLGENRMFGICKRGKDRRNSDVQQRPGLVTGYVWEVGKASNGTGRTLLSSGHLLSSTAAIWTMKMAVVLNV
jgi:hypothetical protein